MENQVAQSNNPDDMYKVLIQKIKEYHPSEDIGIVEKAYEVAFEAHKEQKRKSGEPYIIHPVSVAIILADLKLDKETIAAGLLHDVVEDTDVPEDYLIEIFGHEIMFLVDGVTKLRNLSDKGSGNALELQAENLKKLLWAMAEDIRVILIKLADRLHNMRTLEFQKPEKQIKIAQETLDIYVPIAGKMGIYVVRTELEDLCLKYLHPASYEEITKEAERIKEEKNQFIQTTCMDIVQGFGECEFEIGISDRYKNLFSIYRKMVMRQKEIQEIYDVFTLCIIVESVKECYEALGILHTMYSPIPGRFKDYIALPKSNLYQSIHTTLISPQGEIFEVQIRTEEMDHTATYGILNYWKYKGGLNKVKEEEKLEWLQEILEWQKDSDSTSFVQFVKTDLNVFSDKIRCFTPKGDMLELPKGSTAVDFAYGIHSEIGHHMVAVLVNGKTYGPDYVIQDGDKMEILVDQKNGIPEYRWLSVVKTMRAKNKLLQYFKKEEAREAQKNWKDKFLAKILRQAKEQNTLKTRIRVVGKNRIGLIYNITDVIQAAQVDIQKMEAITDSTGQHIVELQINLDTNEKIPEILKNLEQISDVVEAENMF